jgi:hypothetical protein
MYACMNVYNGWGQNLSGPCTVTIKICCASPTCSSLCQSYISDEAQDSLYGGIMVISWFHENLRAIVWQER